jgi:hypothetical protein
MLNLPIDFAWPSRPSQVVQAIDKDMRPLFAERLRWLDRRVLPAVNRRACAHVLETVPCALQS